MRVLVTGATGFVGAAVARALVAAGREVRLIARPEADQRNLAQLPAEIFLGDITDLEAMKRATDGCRQVYHVAALYKLWVRRRREIYLSNVTGTENMLKAAQACGVEKIVYTSSVATLGLPSDGSPGTEETPVSLADMTGDYKRSKYLAEQVVLQYAREGLPVVIVNPSTPVGIADVKPTPTGKIIVDFLNRKIPAYVDTGLNLVDVDDVAQGHLLAADKGRIGEKYILGNENLTLRQLFLLLAELTGQTVPRFKAPYWLSLGVAYVDAALARAIPGREPFIPPVGVKLSRKKMFFDSRKAVQELGLPQTPVREALRKAVLWFARNGYAQRSRRSTEELP